MSIPSADLRLRVGNTSIHFSTGLDTMGKEWEVCHDATGITVASGTVARQVATVGQIQSADADLQNSCESAFSEIKAQHEPIGVIGGYSAWDADLILDEWMQDEDSMQHPICGDIVATPAGLAERVNAILGARLPPPQWFWAEGLAGKARVRCVAVAGADSYNVYNGETFVLNVPTAGWEDVPLVAGTYSLRSAPVEAGQAGILSFPILVEVS